jgi:hypothetical protein
MALDEELKRVRTRTGKYPISIILKDDPFNAYVPIPLLVQDPVTKQNLRVAHKPAWVRVRRLFFVRKPNAN